MEQQIISNMCLCMLLFPIIGTCIWIIPMIIERKRAWNYSSAVQAQVYDRKDINKRGVTYTYLTWRYEYEGKEYFYKSRYGTVNEERKIGDWGTLAVKKKKPSKVYAFTLYKNQRLLKIIGILFIIVGTICLVIFLYILHVLHTVQTLPLM